MSKQTDHSADAEANFEGFLARLSDRDRQNVERHLTACATEPTTEHAVLWKRLAGLMSMLAPHALQTNGQGAVQFFISDGQYRKQIFALEDARNGLIVVYCVDALDPAVRAGVLRSPAEVMDGDIQQYGIQGDRTSTIGIEVLTAAKTASAPEYFRHMLGWNRKAVRIVLPVTASPAQIKAAESLMKLGATQATPPKSAVATAKAVATTAKASTSTPAKAAPSPSAKRRTTTKSGKSSSKAG